MKRFLKRLRRIVETPLILPEYLSFRGKDRSRRFPAPLSAANPQLFDRTFATGFDRHYVYHTSWAARVLAETRPERHVDVSSSLYFGGIVSAFVPVDFYDYRPADLELPGFSSNRGDLTALPFPDGSVPSLSCMHTVEHVGLGRYGDPVDPDGDVKAARELARVLSPGGALLFVVPAAEKPLIEFNAHRIYSYAAVLDLFPGLVLKEFSLIPEHAGPLIRNADPKLLAGESYACGCFVFTKEA
jgi:SAM-dependent methyltransferase